MFLVSLLLPVGAGSQPAQYNGPGYSKQELAPGVWAFVFDNQLGDQGGVDGTAVVIINEDDAVLIDTQGSPRTARRIQAEIRALTPKPVRYVVNTHWHGDHWLGNQVYQEAYPGVEFIAHPKTVTDIDQEELPGIEAAWKTNLPTMVKDLEGRYAKGIRRDGKPYSTTDSAMVRRQIASLEWSIGALREVRPVKPTLLVADSLILRRGERTIVIRHLGRGNTRGDLSVWLPTERILVTGDLLVNPVPYSFGSYLSEWIGTLTRLRALPAVAVVPGHGAVQRDWAYLDLFVELLQSTLDQAKAAVATGLDLAATRKAVDLAQLKARFTEGNDLRERAFDAFFATPAIERAWLEARGELDQPKR
jgi:glyoxylase-like metal-dependent hydrolase (beta-lactamase superfamily II)